MGEGVPADLQGSLPWVETVRRVAMEIRSDGSARVKVDDWRMKMGWGLNPLAMFGFMLLSTFIVIVKSRVMFQICFI